MRVRIRGVCIDQRRSSIVSVRSSSVLSRTAPFYLIYFLFHTIGIQEERIEFEKRTRERRVSTAGFAFGQWGHWSVRGVAFGVCLPQGGRGNIRAWPKLLYTSGRRRRTFPRLEDVGLGHRDSKY